MSRLQVAVLIVGLSYPTETVLSNTKITRNRIVPSFKDSPRKPLGRRPYQRLPLPLMMMMEEKSIRQRWKKIPGPPGPKFSTQGSTSTVIGARMSHWKWRETKQHPSRARSGHQISCCLVSRHFLCDILAPITVDAIPFLTKKGH